MFHLIMDSKFSLPLNINVLAIVHYNGSDITYNRSDTTDLIKTYNRSDTTDVIQHTPDLIQQIWYNIQQIWYNIHRIWYNIQQNWYNKSDTACNRSDTTDAMQQTRQVLGVDVLTRFKVEDHVDCLTIMRNLLVQARQIEFVLNVVFINLQTLQELYNVIPHLLCNNYKYILQRSSPDAHNFWLKHNWTPHKLHLKLQG